MRFVVVVPPLQVFVGGDEGFVEILHFDVAVAEEPVEAAAVNFYGSPALFQKAQVVEGGSFGIGCQL